jgi:DNA-binding NtrC family response regulator
VILITAFGSAETAVQAMKMGARDYVLKPFKIDELQTRIQMALDYQAAVGEVSYLRKELKERHKLENIIGTSGKMEHVYSLISKVADTDSTVLIVGESGTGKELVARGLHFNSNRQHHPFVAINCSALPENLLESELFGHKKGSFTGAVADKRGLFEEANLGTIFLDEVNSMAPALQTKLLRVLQEREVRRVGDNKSAPVNVRVVGATNERLQPKLKDGTFREDLYYRLAVIPIEIPPLRERLEDVPLLVNHFLQKQASATGGEPKKIDPVAVDILCHYSYPGNGRAPCATMI